MRYSLQKSRPSSWAAHMTKHSMRAYQHGTHFYPGELAAFQSVLVRLGLPLESFTKQELKKLAAIVYNLPYGDRDDVNKVYAGLQIAKQTLGTILRREIEIHANDPKFREAVRFIVKGNPNGLTSEDTKGLEGLLEDIFAFVNDGTEVMSLQRPDQAIAATQSVGVCDDA